MNIQKSVTLPPTQPVWRQKFLQFLRYVWIYNIIILGITLDATTYIISDLLNRLMGYPVINVYPTNNVARGFESFVVSRQSPNNTLVAAAGATKVDDKFVARVVLWDKNSKRLWEVTQTNMDGAKLLIWSKDQNYLIASSQYDQKSILIDVKKGKIVNFFNTSAFSLFHPSTHQRGENSKTVQADSDVLVGIKPLDQWNTVSFDIGFDPSPAQYKNLGVAGTSGEDIQIVNSDTPEHTPVLLHRKDGSKESRSVENSKFSPDGTLLAAGYGDGTLIVWDVTSGLEKWRAKPLESDIVVLEWNTDGTAIATSSFDGCGWGWLRSECVAVTRANRDSHPTQIVWSRRWKVSRSLQWTAPDQLLITLDDRALEVNVGL